MNNLLKVVLLILLIEVGVIIGANIPKQISVKEFDAKVLNQLESISLSEFNILYNETIKDTQGIGLGKGIVEYKWNIDFELGVNAKDWTFNARFQDNVVYLDAPELIFLKSKLQLIEKIELDAAKDERTARMLEQANKSASGYFLSQQKQIVSSDSIYYQHAKSQLKEHIKKHIKRDFPNLIMDEIVINNWP